MGWGFTVGGGCDKEDETIGVGSKDGRERMIAGPVRLRVSLVVGEESGQAGGKI